MKLVVVKSNFRSFVSSCDDPYVSYDAYHISLDTILFLTHSLYDLLSFEMATSAG